jgi:hypothetical protein
MHLARERDKWWAVLNTVMNLRTFGSHKTRRTWPADELLSFHGFCSMELANLLFPFFSRVTWWNDGTTYSSKLTPLSVKFQYASGRFYCDVTLVKSLCLKNGQFKQEWQGVLRLSGNCYVTVQVILLRYTTCMLTPVALQSTAPECSSRPTFSLLREFASYIDNKFCVCQRLWSSALLLPYSNYLSCTQYPPFPTACIVFKAVVQAYNVRFVSSCSTTELHVPYNYHETHTDGH